MNFRRLISVVICLTAFAAQAQNTSNSRDPRTWPVHRFSAMRAPSEPFEHAYSRYLTRKATAIRARIFGAPQAEAGPTALQAARPLNQLDFSSLPRWESPQFTAQAFDKIRDIRFLSDPQHPGMPRRDSWLYPDDGCFARASMVVANLAKMGITQPEKVFIFGNLTVKTPNSPQGEVSWWYHVVPIVMVQNQPVVLDPSINPYHPLTLQQWAATMTNDPTSVKVSICSTHTYEPGSVCNNAPVSEDAEALSAQQGFLSYEWARVVQLNEDPTRVLGEFPPWLNPPAPSN